MIQRFEVLLRVFLLGALTFGTAAVAGADTVAPDVYLARIVAKGATGDASFTGKAVIVTTIDADEGQVFPMASCGGANNWPSISYRTVVTEPATRALLMDQFPDEALDPGDRVEIQSDSCQCCLHDAGDSTAIVSCTSGSCSDGDPVIWLATGTLAQ